jgi:hypothetical protein
MDAFIGELWLFVNALNRKSGNPALIKCYINQYLAKKLEKTPRL